ncbi:hypothetical protein Hanom_Chr11g01045051 [Helianthus anomalus]
MFLVIPLSKIAELVDLDFSVPCGLARWRLRWWSSELGAMELWYYAVLVLIAGNMPNTEVAISEFTICLDINSWEFMRSLGFYGARCVRLANELGRGNAKAVKFYHRQVGHGMFQQMTEEVLSNKYCYEEP